MKLLFDQNLSPHLVALLADVFPESNHVYPLGLDRVLDGEVWNHARDNGFVMVSKEPRRKRRGFNDNGKECSAASSRLALPGIPSLEQASSLFQTQTHSSPPQAVGHSERFS